MGGYWSKRAAQVVTGVILSILMLAGVAIWQTVQTALGRAATLDERARLANQSGIPADPAFLSWPTDVPASRNAWTRYRSLLTIGRAMKSPGASHNDLTSYVFFTALKKAETALDAELLSSLVEASKLETCSFPMEWHQTAFGPYRMLVDQCLYLCAGAIDALARGQSELAKTRVLAASRMAAHVGQGVLREASWARTKCEQLALKAAMRVSAAQNPAQALAFLKEVRASLGPAPTITASISGELVRARARVDRAKLLPGGHKAPFEDVVKASWSSQIVDRFQALAVELNSAGTERDQVAMLEKMDDWSRDRRLLRPYLPRFLERTGWSVCSSLARRRMLEGVIAWMETGKPPTEAQARDPFTGGRFLASEKGYGLKTAGRDGAEQYPGEFWERKGPQEDVMLLLAVDPS